MMRVGVCHSKSVTRRYCGVLGWFSHAGVNSINGLSSEKLGKFSSRGVFMPTLHKEFCNYACLIGVTRGFWTTGGRIGVSINGDTWTGASKGTIGVGVGESHFSGFSLCLLSEEWLALFECILWIKFLREILSSKS